MTMLIPAHAQYNQRRTVCGGRLRLNQMSTNVENRASSLHELSRALHFMREMSKDIVHIYNEDLMLSNERIYDEEFECVLQMIPLSYASTITIDNLSTTLNDTFSTLGDILSLLRTIKEQTNDITLCCAISNLENLAYDALCSLNHLGLGAGVTLSRQIFLTHISLPCYDLNRARRFLIEREIFRNIISVSNGLFHSYSDLRHQI